MTTARIPPPSPLPGGGTRVVLPPLSPSPATASISSNPTRLLDAFDTYVSTQRGGNIGRTSGSNTVSNNNNKASNGSSNDLQPDPIAFLNQHFSSEALLVAQLPHIRDAISERMDRLDDRISNALQKQSESAEATQKHVQDAKVSVASLEKRIRLVQEKASQSEKTVREITKDMKRLDCAKRHLQRTITTLKRLHMLIHAVEGLRQACLLRPFPDYKSASHLVDATRLLLKHFDAYTTKVEPMRLLSNKVNDLQDELKFTLVRGFRIVGFGIEQTTEMEKKDMLKSLVLPDDVNEEDDDDIAPPSGIATATTEHPTAASIDSPVVMTAEALAGGIMLIDAIGKEARIAFMTGFLQDFLVEYSRIYKPVKGKPEPPKEKPRVSSFMAQPETPEPKKENIKPEFALEYIENRFLWFRNLLTEIQGKYPGVFPPYWNLEYHLTKNFLRRVRYKPSEFRPSGYGTDSSFYFFLDL
jgi:hypothetical protein